MDLADGSLRLRVTGWLPLRKNSQNPGQTLPGVIK
jgi:hypothetical protein